MPNMRSSGVFSDQRSPGGGLYRGSYIDGVKVPGIPIEYISSREMVVSNIDFLDPQDINTANTWELVEIGTQTTGGFAIAAGQVGGVGRLTSDATTGDGLSMVYNRVHVIGAAVIPSAGNVITFEARIRASNWNLIHWYVGLFADAPTDPILDTNGDFTNNTMHAGFHYNNDDDVTGIPRITYAGSGGSDITVTADRPIAAGVDDEWRNFAVRLVGTDKLEFYVDDVLVGSDTVASPFTAVILPVSWCYIMDDNGGGTFDMDYFITSQRR